MIRQNEPRIRPGLQDHGMLVTNGRATFSTALDNMIRPNFLHDAN